MAEDYERPTYARAQELSRLYYRAQLAAQSAVAENREAFLSANVAAIEIHQNQDGHEYVRVQFREGRWNNKEMG